MKVKDIVERTCEHQDMSVEVMMQDDLDDGTLETYSMVWKGCAKDVPKYIMTTDVKAIRSDVHGIHIMSEE